MGIAKLGDLWYATARWGGGDDAWVPVVFTSADGRVWNHLQSTDWWGYITTALASDGMQLIATNYEFALGRGSLFTSPDGTSWTEHLADGGPASMLDVIADADGILAVGYRDLSGTGETPVVWISDDGKIWSEVAVPDAPSRTVPWSIARADNGTYVMLTTTTITPSEPCSPEAPCPPDTLGVWYSADGKTWQAGQFPQVEVPSGFQFDMWLVPASSGLVAVATTFDGPAAWSSLDGAKWEPLALPDSMTSSSITSVASDGTTVLLFGSGDEGTEIVIGEAKVGN